MGNIGIWQLVIVLVIVLLLFGGKKLRTLGSDLGSAVKGFKNSVTEDKHAKDADFAEPQGVQDKSTADQSEGVNQKQKAE